MSRPPLPPQSVKRQTPRDSSSRSRRQPRGDGKDRLLQLSASCTIACARRPRVRRATDSHHKHHQPDLTVRRDRVISQAPSHRIVTAERRPLLPHPITALDEATDHKPEFPSRPARACNRIAHSPGPTADEQMPPWLLVTDDKLSPIAQFDAPPQRAGATHMPMVGCSCHCSTHLPHPASFSTAVSPKAARFTTQ